MSDKFDDGRLIELVRDFSHIYDKTNKNHKNRLAVQNAWKTISESMNIPGELCEQRWSNIRHRFAKERRLIKNMPSGSAARCTWPYYDICCSFLDNVILQRKTTGNVSTPIRQTGEPKMEVTPDITIDDENQHDSTSRLAETDAEARSEFSTSSDTTEATNDQAHMRPVTSSVQTSRKRSKVNSMQQLSQSFQDAVDKLANYGDEGREDEDDVFGKAVALELKKIHVPKLKLLLKSNILQLLADACEDI